MNTKLAERHYTSVEADAFDVFAALVAKTFALITGPLFTTDVAKGRLFQTYLRSFTDPAERQHHNCSCCRHFLERYGSLATIDIDGTVIPAMWSCDETSVPPMFRPAFRAMRKVVSNAEITGVFLSKDKVLGTPQTGKWKHFAVTQSKASIYTERNLTAGQAMAAKREEHRMLVEGLSKIAPKTLDVAISLLESEHLYRSDKFLGVAQGWRDLKKIGKVDPNAYWRAVAKHGPGFSHIGSSVLNTLLEDIAAGHPLKAIKARFDDKVDPLNYLRPQAAPKVGSIQAAEETIAKMNLAPALERRVAEFAEVIKYAVWKPKLSGKLKFHKSPTGMFASLNPAQPALVSSNPITWVKFGNSVLNTALAIQVIAKDNMPYGGITAAVHKKAKQLWAWKHPFSWYKWPTASAANFDLLPGAQATVMAITPLPCNWGDGEGRFTHHGVILLLDGACDLNLHKAGINLYPELLAPELHGIRRVIEAYSNSKTLAPAQNPAMGLVLRKGVPINLDVLVTTPHGVVAYKIDRWE